MDTLPQQGSAVGSEEPEFDSTLSDQIINMNDPTSHMATTDSTPSNQAEDENIIPSYHFADYVEHIRPRDESLHLILPHPTLIPRSLDLDTEDTAHSYHLPSYNHPREELQSQSESILLKPDLETGPSDIPSYHLPSYTSYREERTRSEDELRQESSDKIPSHHLPSYDTQRDEPQIVIPEALKYFHERSKDIDLDRQRRSLSHPTKNDSPQKSSDVSFQQRSKQHDLNRQIRKGKLAKNRVESQTEIAKASNTKPEYTLPRPQSDVTNEQPRISFVADKLSDISQLSSQEKFRLHDLNRLTRLSTSPQLPSTQPTIVNIKNYQPPPVHPSEHDFIRAEAQDLQVTVPVKDPSPEPQNKTKTIDVPPSPHKRNININAPASPRDSGTKRISNGQPLTVTDDPVDSLSERDLIHAPASPRDPDGIINEPPSLRDPIINEPASPRDKLNIPASPRDPLINEPASPRDKLNIPASPRDPSLNDPPYPLENPNIPASPRDTPLETKDYHPLPTDPNSSFRRPRGPLSQNNPQTEPSITPPLSTKAHLRTTLERRDTSPSQIPHMPPHPTRFGPVLHNWPHSLETSKTGALYETATLIMIAGAIIVSVIYVVTRDAEYGVRKEDVVSERGGWRWVPLMGVVARYTQVLGVCIVGVFEKRGWDVWILKALVFGPEVGDYFMSIIHILAAYKVSSILLFPCVKRAVLGRVPAVQPVFEFILAVSATISTFLVLPITYQLAKEMTCTYGPSDAFLPGTDIKCWNNDEHVARAGTAGAVLLITVPCFILTCTEVQKSCSQMATNLSSWFLALQTSLQIITPLLYLHTSTFDAPYTHLFVALSVMAISLTVSKHGCTQIPHLNATIMRLGLAHTMTVALSAILQKSPTYILISGFLTIAMTWPAIAYYFLKTAATTLPPTQKHTPPPTLTLLRSHIHATILAKKTGSSPPPQPTLPTLTKTTTKESQYLDKVQSLLITWIHAPDPIPPVTALALVSAMEAGDIEGLIAAVEAGDEGLREKVEKWVQDGCGSRVEEVKEWRE
ncbi:hypothetical protein HDU79_007428, partial [Rhizoclosmatium sp. JEL0117]